MECKDEDNECSIVQFEHQWRLHLADFERQRLQYAGFCCGLKDTLYGVDNSIFGQELQQLYIQSTIEAAASPLHGAHNSMGVVTCKAPGPQGHPATQSPLSSPKKWVKTPASD